MIESTATHRFRDPGPEPSLAKPWFDKLANPQSFDEAAIALDLPPMQDWEKQWYHKMAAAASEIIPAETMWPLRQIALTAHSIRSVCKVLTVVDEDKQELEITRRTRAIVNAVLGVHQS